MNIKITPKQFFPLLLILVGSLVILSLAPYTFPLIACFSFFIFVYISQILIFWSLACYHKNTFKLPLGEYIPSTVPDWLTTVYIMLYVGSFFLSGFTFIFHIMNEPFIFDEILASCKEFGISARLHLLKF